MACFESGTEWLRFPFIRSSGISHKSLSKSISDHFASYASAGRTIVIIWNSRACLIGSLVSRLFQQFINSGNVPLLRVGLGFLTKGGNAFLMFESGFTAIIPEFTAKSITEFRHVIIPPTTDGLSEYFFNSVMIYGAVN